MGQADPNPQTWIHIIQTVACQIYTALCNVIDTRGIKALGECQPDHLSTLHSLTIA